MAGFVLLAADFASSLARHYRLPAYFPNRLDATQKVTVADNHNPTITAPDDVTVSTDSGQCYASGVSLGSATSSDNCPGSSASNNAPSQFNVGSTTVSWTVTDASGNTATDTQTVKVEDHEQPELTACSGTPPKNSKARMGQPIKIGKARLPRGHWPTFRQVTLTTPTLSDAEPARSSAGLFVLQVVARHDHESIGVEAHNEVSDLPLVVVVLLYLPDLPARD